MSRSALQAQDRETFIKSQILACQKVLSKAEAPIKQKHVRALIVGTHKEKSAHLFWHTISRIQIEKNPIVTWKFCQLLHKLIHDGHRRVPDDCARHISRLVHLGNFWQHLRATGYGQVDALYCRLLTKRLQLHQKFPQIPGNLTLSDAQVASLLSDVNNGFELAIDVLDQLDELMAFKTAVISLVETFRWTSMLPQCQCLLAPLILVILDTSVLYDCAVKILFRLHSSLPVDVLMGHRERFSVLFKKIKEFYQACTNMQYFRYLVSIPSLPSHAPNFLQSSDLDSYETQHAFLRAETAGSDGTESPTDSQSIQDDVLIDITLPETSTPAPTNEANEHNEMMAQLDELRRALDNEMKAKDDILNEARSRIDQYERRLVELKQESDTHAKTADETLLQLRALKETANASEKQLEIQRQAEEKAADLDRKYQKLKAAYETFRKEHLDMLYELRDLRKFKTETSTETDDLRRLLSDQEAKFAQAEAQHQKDHLGVVCDAALKMLAHCAEDLQNSSTISYPTHLAESLVKLAHAEFERLGVALDAGKASGEFNEAATMFCHDLTIALVPAAAAAYTTSIEHYEPTVNICKNLTQAAVELYSALQAGRWREAADTHKPTLARLIVELVDALATLPTTSGDVDVDSVEVQLADEMRRMDNAIKRAVERIKQIQMEAHQKNTGTRLEVNEKILEYCDTLMCAVRLLVERSRDLQKEIVDAGRGSATPTEFYKRNHQWTKGLLSAAQAVGVAAVELMNSADKVVLNEGKFEYLIVAAQEISASVAQLFVSSRVKADRGSERMALLGQAAKSVNDATARVVGAVKAGKQTLEEEDLFDFTSMSLHDAKRAEMESQVKALELEAQLGKERTRLAGLRKQHYHLAALVSKGHEEAENA